MGVKLPQLKMKKYIFENIVSKPNLNNLETSDKTIIYLFQERYPAVVAITAQAVTMTLRMTTWWIAWEIRSLISQNFRSTASEKITQSDKFAFEFSCHRKSSQSNIFKKFQFTEFHTKCSQTWLKELG